VRGFVTASLVAFATATALAAPPAAQALDGPALVAKLQSWLDGTKDLKGRFEQRLVSGALGPGDPERGTMLLVRPGRMRWDYESPEKKVAIVDGGATLVYLPAERQLIRGRIDGEGGALGSLLTGGARVTDLFSPLLVATPRKGGASVYKVRLAPRAEEQGLEAVLLTLRPPQFAIEAAEVVDPAGNVIEYRFESIQRNRGIPLERFHFEAPPGTEIVDSAAR